MSTAAGGEPLTSSFPSWNFADRMRKIRRDVLDMEQAELARELGVTKAAYAAWESGRNEPRSILAVAKKVELLSRVPAAWILGVDEQPPVTRPCRPSSADAVAKYGQLTVVSAPNGPGSVVPTESLIRAAAEVTQRTTHIRTSHLAPVA